MLLSKLLSAGGALTLLVAVSATGGCTTVIAQEPPGGGPTDATPGDGAGSSSSGGSGSSGSSSSGGGFDAGACLPGDVTTYAPQYHPATGAYQGKCASDMDVQGFYDACLGTKASTDACNAFRTVSQTADCAACILTPDADSNYGPLIGHGSFVTANVAGCIELTDATTTGLACAKAVQAVAGCELLACEANCDVHDASSLGAYDTCASTADQAGCVTYASASSCVTALQEAGDGVAQCLAQDFTTFYYVAAKLFCGAQPAVDGGAPYDTGSPAPDGSTAAD